MERIKWTSRKFDFGFTAEHLPLLIERLKAPAPRIRELIEGCDERTLAAQPGTAWSVKQHIGHLTDLEELHEARILQFAQGAALLHAADMSNRKTYEASHNDRSASELLREFRETRDHFIARICKLPQSALLHKALHPRLQQQITVPDLAYFVAEHDTQHLAIMAELLGK
jgi:hypothetical protein